MEILGVKIDNFSTGEIFQRVDNFLREDKFHQIATINPEFILQAQDDEGFKNIINSSDLGVADGIGIRFAFFRYGKILKTRFSGIDFMMEILKIAEKENLKVFLVSYNGALSTWKEAREAILKIHPNLEISGGLVDTSYPFGCPISREIENYEIVFCNFGAPDQEKFIHSLKSPKDSKIRLAMGVGGSLDFLTGKRKRAPKFLQKIGLEWLWRFVQEPKYRAKRIFRAVVIFPIKVIFN